jgi:hypothetical protein
MSINYIILAHKNPTQLNRLIRKLYEPWTYLYIHIDRNINIKPFKDVLKEFENVIFLENDDRYSGVWGDIGIVKGTLSAMRRIVNDKKKGYTVLLSGQDYPLRNNKNIYDFFKDSHNNHIEIKKIDKLWGTNGLDRITKYKINKSNKRGDFMLLPTIFDKNFYKSKTFGKLNFLRKSRKFESIFKIFRKRRFPIHIEAYGGSVYWAFPTTTIEKILEFIKNNPHYIIYHKYSLCPDEIFFHSIIAHLQIINDIPTENSITYVNWDKKNVKLPVTFEKSDFNELQNASINYLFARKFDIDIDNGILDKLDSEFLN